MRSGLLKQIAAERLKVIEPEAYEECEKMLVAPLTDFRLLPAVLDVIFQYYQPKPENSPFILAVVYYLYAPYKLHYQSIRSGNGIRSALCEAFKWNDAPVVNHYIKIMVVYYKNPRWAEKVKELADRVHQVVKDNEAQILAAINKNNNGQ